MWSNFGNFQIKIQFTVSNKYCVSSNRRLADQINLFLPWLLFYLLLVFMRLLFEGGVYFFGKLTAELGGCMYC